MIRRHIVTIKILECVLVDSVIFLFYIPRTRAVAPRGTRGGLNLQQIFKTSKILKRPIVNALVLRYLEILNF